MGNKSSQATTTTTLPAPTQSIQSTPTTQSTLTQPANNQQPTPSPQQISNNSLKKHPSKSRRQFLAMPHEKVPYKMLNLPPQSSLRPLIAQYHSPAKDTTLDYYNLHEISQTRPIKIFLAAAGEVGKTTFARGLTHVGCIIDEFDELRTDNFISFRTTVLNNIMIGFESSARYTLEYSKDKLSPDTLQIAREFTRYEDLNRAYADAKDCTKYEAFWADPYVQHAWSKRNLGDQGIFPMDYWMNKIRHVTNKDYVPTREDVVRTRVRTTGIIEMHLATPKGAHITAYDVGGQRNERKKWIHAFADVHIIISLVSLSEFNQTCFEDNYTNRHHESFKLISEMFTSRWFQQSHHILLLTKHDLFLEEVEKGEFGIIFPDYAGSPTDADAILDFIVAKYRQFDHKMDIFVINPMDMNDVAQVLYHISNMIDPE